MDHIDALIHAKLLSYGWTAVATAELILAALCGGLVGIEREVRGRQAGFRTNLLVCVGSALVMVVSNHVAHLTWPAPTAGNIQINIDPARIAYGVMAGIGFLGAGTIVKNGGSVRGLTTAAGLWCVAALGMAAGLGMYVVTAVTTLLLLLTLWGLDYFESMMPTTYFRAVRVRCRWEPGAIDRVVDWLKGSKLRVLDVHFERSDDLKNIDVDVTVSFRRKENLYKLEHRAQLESDFHLMAIREP